MILGPKQIVLSDARSNGHRRHVWARLGTEGELIVEGQDLGDGASLGYREYEWSMTVAAADMPKLMAALNVRGLLGTSWGRGPRLLAALRQRFAGPDASKLELFLKEHDIPFSLWNRIGD